MRFCVCRAFIAIGSGHGRARTPGASAETCLQGGRGQPHLSGTPRRQFLCDARKTGRVSRVGLCVGVDGGIDIADGLERAAQVVPGLDAVGGVHQSGAIGHHGMSSVPSLDHSRSEVVQKQGIARTNCDGFPKHLDSSVEIAVPKMHFGFIDQTG